MGVENYVVQFCIKLYGVFFQDSDSHANQQQTHEPDNILEIEGAVQGVVQQAAEHLQHHQEDSESGDDSENDPNFIPSPDELSDIEDPIAVEPEAATPETATPEAATPEAATPEPATIDGNNNVRL